MQQVGKHTFFASDLHLGAPNWSQSREREDRFIRWMNSIEADAAALYLVGDVFDFWFEYNTVVPKGFIRLLGKLAEWRAKGIEIVLFSGNHDLWYREYFVDELDIPVHHHPIQLQLGDKQFFIGHGDGLGPGDHGYKFLKRVFTNPLCKWAFRWLHPDIGVRMASFWSRRSRLSQGSEAEQYLGEDEEWLILFAKEQLKERHYDYFVFGHRHLPLDIQLDNSSKYINLGDWINYNSYAVFDGKELHLRYFEET